MNQNSPKISLHDLAETDHPFGNDKGKEVFLRLIESIDLHPSARIFEISLEGIRATDSSFPRESVVALAKMKREEIGLFLKGLSSEDLRDNWHYAAIAKSQPLIVSNESGYQFLGPSISPSNQKLIDFVYSKKRVTTSEVSEELGLSVPNASARLKNLASKGYLLRIEETAQSGGKEFIYIAISD